MDAGVGFTVNDERWALVNSDTGAVALEGPRRLVEDQAATLSGFDAVLKPGDSQ